MTIIALKKKLANIQRNAFASMTKKEGVDQDKSGRIIFNYCFFFIFGVNIINIKPLALLTSINKESPLIRPLILILLRKF